MQTVFRWYFHDSSSLGELADESAALVVSSPPYPMIAMWDNLFSARSAEARDALAAEDGNRAFGAMHEILDAVWKECGRVLVRGGFACVNIGDAVRSLGGSFRLYPNHARIIGAFQKLGFDVLPEILWRKQTNAPTKFMGSGMYPAGAYVTLEHEFILIFRKGGPRDMSASADKSRRREGACFWEERNKWYSDLWDFKGIRQGSVKAGKDRTAAFPFELARRLILMYSLPGDLVVDPFLGTGTTGLACMALGRSCAGYEIEPRREADILAAVNAFTPACANALIQRRITDHEEFAAQRLGEGRPLRYRNSVHGFPVMTRQEERLRILRVQDVRVSPGEVTVSYE